MGRLRLRRDFERLRRDGATARSGPVLVVSVVDPGVVPPRVAFAIPRKVGSAVRRNRIRRQLRAHLAACDLAAGLHLIRVLPHAAELDGDELRRHLERAIARPGVAA